MNNNQFISAKELDRIFDEGDHQDKDDTMLSPTKENLSHQLEIPLFMPVSAKTNL